MKPTLCIGTGYCTWPLRPRWPFGRIPKDMEKLIRPKLVLTAGIAHGWTTGLFLSQENVFHGADAFLEVLHAPMLCFWTSCSAPADASRGIADVKAFATCLVLKRPGVSCLMRCSSSAVRQGAGSRPTWSSSLTTRQPRQRTRPFYCFCRTLWPVASGPLGWTEHQVSGRRSVPVQQRFAPIRVASAKGFGHAPSTS